MSVLETLAAEVGITPSLLAERLTNPPVSEAAVPTYLTIDPTTGLIGALFTGGIQMLENATGNYTAGSALGWKDPTTGDVRSFLEGFKIGTNHFLHLASQPDANDWAYLNCEAHPAGGAGSSQLNVSTADSAGHLSSGTLLDSLGRSNFLQLLSAQQLQLALGTATMTWPGGSAISNGLAIAHGIGRNPTVFFGTSGSVTGDADSVLLTQQGSDATHINFDGRTITAFMPAAGATNTVLWIAIG